MAAFYTYVLANPAGRIYVGQTNDIERRLAEHNDPDYRGTLHTKRHPGPWRLLLAESFTTRAEAIRHEKALKGGQGREWIREHLLPTDAGGC